MYQAIAFLRINDRMHNVLDLNKKEKTENDRIYL